MENNKLEIQRVIQCCGCDKVLPLCLVYVFYIILHGHLSPGGGFQGGIMMVATVLLVYLGHGYQETKRALVPDTMHALEGVALILYIAFAFAGVSIAAAFCGNFAYASCNIGELFSSGTVFLMNSTVGFDVFTGAIVISIGMLSVLFPQDIDAD